MNADSIKLNKLLSTVDDIIKKRYTITEVENSFHIQFEMNVCNVITLCEEICSELEYLIVKKGLNIKVDSLDQLANYQRAFSWIFVIAGYNSADLIIEQLELESSVMSGERLVTLYCFVTTETKKLIRLKIYIEANPDLYVTTCLTQIWATSQSHQSLINREFSYFLLGLFAEKYENFSMPLENIAGYFMHSSYGFNILKHDIKKLIYKYIINIIPPDLKKRIKEYDEDTHNFDRKNIVLVLDHFAKYHSVYRVLGPSIESLKSRFKITAVVHEDLISTTYTEIFDQIVVLKGNNLFDVLQQMLFELERLKPCIIYYPGIGMSPWTIFLSAFRLAPVQICSLGHAASSHSPSVDYFITEYDFSGSPAVYTEELICCDIGSMTFVEPENVKYPEWKERNNSSINICVNGSHMKINAILLELCKNIQNSYKSGDFKIKFHFFVYGLECDVHGIQFKKLTDSFIEGCIFHYTQSFDKYLEEFSEMDIVLNPFPYGNMNSLIDTFKLGVIPVCMIGDHPHECIDAALIARAGLDNLLIANNIVDYERAIRILIEDYPTRISIRNSMKNLEFSKIFSGKSTALSEKFEYILNLKGY